ncbi:MAG: PEP-CTERM sorting domain-containing protein [Akkermansiaceae bacterium]|nr:PEP-CTERM sorting domain-containing protein [Akkermansiaceae bacterium]
MSRLPHRLTLPLLTSVLVANSASGVVVMLSDTELAGAELETWIQGAFANVTEIRHGDYANYGAATTQDALNGTGAFAGNGAAEVVIIGRTLSSAAYGSGNAQGYNTLTIPVVSLTSYVSRDLGGRLGWHTGSATNGPPTAGAETTVTPVGTLVTGAFPGSYDFFNSADGSFNGAATTGANLGDGLTLATFGTGAVQSAYWLAGAAPGNPTVAGVTTFPGPRLLFNIDNDGPGGDLGPITPAGQDALRNAIAFASPLVVPEPSSLLLSFLGLGLLVRRRR